MIKFISYSSIQIYPCSPVRMATYRLGIQLFKERLSEKCTQQFKKVLWVVLSSLFFKEICKNGTRGHRLMFAIAKGKHQK